MPAIAWPASGHVIKRKPVMDLAGPDQMLRQLVLTAKRTMTRADDVNGGLDKGAAIREPAAVRK